METNISVGQDTNLLVKLFKRKVNKYGLLFNFMCYFFR